MSRNKDVPTGTKLGDLKRIGGFDLGIYYNESETHKWGDDLDTFERAMKAMQDTYNRLKAQKANEDILRKAEAVEIIDNSPTNGYDGVGYQIHISDLSEEKLLEYREMFTVVLMEEYNLEVAYDHLLEHIPAPDWEKLLDIDSMTLDEMKAIVFDVGVGAGIDWKAICRLIKEAV